MQEEYELPLVYQREQIFFTKVQTFHLREALGDESCLVAYHHTMLIFLVLEYPFGINHILAFWSFNKLTYLIPCEVVQLILHCHDPIFFLQGVIYIFGFYKKRRQHVYKRMHDIESEFLPLGKDSQ